MFDLDAYLARIGLSGSPGLAEVHRAHATTIPFENLDPQRGVPVSLDMEDLQRKLVGEDRGGYCFEQNLLLKAALEAMGAQVELFLARVRYRAEGAIRPRGHLAMRVSMEGEKWLADVGFGLGTLLEPLPFAVGAEQEQSGWGFRIDEGGTELVLQGLEEGGWVDLYGFVPEAVPLIDVEISNWWISTHPRSPFVTGLIVSGQDEEGRRTTVSDWGELVLTERSPRETKVTAVTREEVPALLAECFALEGFALGAEGEKLVRTQ